MSRRIGRRRLGGADFHIAIDGDGVTADDFALEVAGEVREKGGFAAAGGTEEDEEERFGGETGGGFWLRMARGGVPPSPGGGVWQAIESIGSCFVVEFDNIDGVSQSGTKRHLQLSGPGSRERSSGCDSGQRKAPSDGMRLFLTIDSEYQVEEEFLPKLLAL